ncbi:hypothetical protein SCP_0404320 [Sparassis crispa]|uniref:N-acetyltransferase ECO1 n=1 Tax=Sparassis crispa TaxID=139825 RepID=A0A401GIM3_9APHY|nr:hypothetical protein SCP_0404320 [Sparassis crispa]GBE82054.1 hypothetical protein SCP_0404320 [Sparassis crispa]
MTPRVKRTYGSRAARPPIPSSPPSDLYSSPPTLKRKRPLADSATVSNAPPAKKQHHTAKPPAKSQLKTRKGKEPPKQKKFTQLHFSLDTTVLRTCPLCDLSYTKGAPDDESLHKKHCVRVQRGLEWGKDEEREVGKVGVEEIATGLKLKSGVKGRIICFRPDVGGKIGAKLTTLLETIRLALSSPPLSRAVLKHSKFYLFLLPSTSNSTNTAPSARETIVGCVIAQRISTAMAVASDADLSPSGARTHMSLISVDTSTNLYVRPAPLPTPLGIPRLFVSSSHRRLGIASHLLSAAASTFILGCPLDPAKGEVAFTQPTGAGKAVLEVWGKGGVRIYEEEQRLG